MNPHPATVNGSPRPAGRTVALELPDNANIPPIRGWFKTTRSDDALELIGANPLAFVLAAVIAYRGRWHDGFNRFGLGLGEALLGDYRAYGMSEQQYRTAKAQLENWKFATFRATNKGTVGKLTDTRLFSIIPSDSNDQANEQLTTGQRPGNDRVTTNKELKSEKSFKRENGTPSGKKEFWKLHRELQDLQALIDREREKDRPERDVDLIKALKAKILAVRAEMKEPTN